MAAGCRAADSRRRGLTKAAAAVLVAAAAQTLHITHVHTYISQLLYPPPGGGNPSGYIQHQRTHSGRGRGEGEEDRRDFGEECITPHHHSLGVHEKVVVVL